MKVHHSRLHLGKKVSNGCNKKDILLDLEIERAKAKLEKDNVTLHEHIT